MSNLPQRDTVDQLINPFTGETISLEASTGELARFLGDLREAGDYIKDSKRAVTREIYTRLDRDARWTWRGSGVLVEGRSPAPTIVWDAGRLREQLLRFVDEDKISVEALDDAVEATTVYVTHRGGVNKLRKLGGEIADAIEECQHEHAGERYLNVTRFKVPENFDA